MRRLIIALALTAAAITAPTAQADWSATIKPGHYATVPGTADVTRVRCYRLNGTPLPRTFDLFSTWGRDGGKYHVLYGEEMLPIFANYGKRSVRCAART